MITRLHVTSNLFAALLLGLTSAAFVVWLAMSQPWLGLSLLQHQNGTDLEVKTHPQGPSLAIPSGAILLAISASNIAESYSLNAQDILEEPDTLGVPAHITAFFDRQNQLFQVLKQSSITLSYKVAAQSTLEKTALISPATARPITDLPYIFWFQLFVGITGLLLAAWVLSQSRTDFAGRFAFGIACLGLWLVSHSAALYSSRELALPIEQILTASRINFIGSVLAGIGLVNLFLLCPTCIAKPWQLWIAPIVVLPLAALSLFGADWLAMPRQVSMVVSLLMVLISLTLQVIRSRRDTVAWIILTWLGFAVLLNAFGFIFAIILPALNGQEQKISQGYAMGYVLVIYIALSVAVARYRLYDLPDISQRILFYVGGLVPLLIIEAALIYLLSFEAAPAFGLSLALVGLFYLPLRSRLVGLFFRSTDITHDAAFQRINEVVFATDHTARHDAFESLLTWMFRPLQIRPAPQIVPQARLIGNGEALDVPGPADLGDLRLAWAKNGRGLFSKRDLRQVNSILKTLNDLLERHQTYDTAINEERSRINRDVHDNIGILLSSALHSNDVERKDVLIRQTLKDIREIIANPVQDARLMLELIADLRAEISELFEAAEITLSWKDIGLPARTLSSEQVQTLRALCREAANNILKHSNAKHAQFELRLQNNQLIVEITDDGVGIDAGLTLGSGIENLRARVTSQGGAFVIASTKDAGTRIRAQIQTETKHQTYQETVQNRTSA